MALLDKLPNSRWLLLLLLMSSPSMRETNAEENNTSTELSNNANETNITEENNDSVTEAANKEIETTIVAVSTESTDFDLFSEDNSGYFLAGVLAVMRYEKTIPEEELSDYLEPTNEKYIDIKTEVEEIPSVLNGVTLESEFVLTKVSKYGSDKVVVELQATIANAEDVEEMKTFFETTSPYSDYEKRDLFTGRKVNPERNVMLDFKLETPFKESYSSKDSADYEQMKNRIIKSLLPALKSQVPMLESIVLVKLSSGSTVATVSVLADGTGGSTTPSLIEAAAMTVKEVDGITATVARSGSLTVTSAELVNSMISEEVITVTTVSSDDTDSNVTEAPTDETMLDDIYRFDKVPSQANPDSTTITMKYFMNVTVPALLCLTIFIVCMCCCVAHPRSSLCKLCNSNIKKEEE